MSNVKLEMSQLKAEVSLLRPKVTAPTKKSPAKALKALKNRKLIEKMEAVAKGETTSLAELKLAIDNYCEAYGPRINSLGHRVKSQLEKAWSWGDLESFEITFSL